METVSQSYRPLGNQNVVTSAVNAQSNTMRSISGDADPVVVIVMADTYAYCAIGSNPVATAADIQLSPGVPYYFDIYPDEKVGVIQKAAAGIVSVTPCRVGAL
jgi:hypothetical protein